MAERMQFLDHLNRPSDDGLEHEVTEIAEQMRVVLMDFHEQAMAAGGQAGDLADYLAKQLAGDIVKSVADALDRGYRSGFVLGTDAQAQRAN